MIVATVVWLWIYTKSLNCTLLTGGTTSFVNYMSIRLFFKNKPNFCQPQGFTAQSGKGHHQSGLCAVTRPMACVACGCTPIRAPPAFEKMSQAGMESRCCITKLQNLKAGGCFLPMVCTLVPPLLLPTWKEARHTDGPWKVSKWLQSTRQCWASCHTESPQAVLGPPHRFSPSVRRIPWRRVWLPTSVFFLSHT